MINLLPDEIKTEIFYGRRNWWILKRLIIAIICMFLIVFVAIVGMVYSKKSKDALNSELSSAQAEISSSANLEITKDTKDIGNTIKLINDLDKKELSFSKLLRNIGAVMPNGTTLNMLQLSQIQDTQTLPLTVNIKSESLISSLIKEFTQNPQSPFKDAFPNGSTCSEDTANDKYPCSVIINATLKDGLITPKKAETKPTTDESEKPK